MRRGRTIRATGATSLILLAMLVAACGGAEASPSPSIEPVPTTTPTEVPTEAPSLEPASAPPAEVVRLLATCEGVAIRADPSTSAELITRVAKLTKVRVAETLEGEAYTTGSCGSSGNEWLKIDRINGTSVRKLYGVPFGYAAAGFFE